MPDLATVAPAFVDKAHRIVWASVATVDDRERPRSRILHPLWTWGGESLVGIVGTGPTPAGDSGVHVSRLARRMGAD